jgi:hypothetical protein
MLVISEKWKRWKDKMARRGYWLNGMTRKSEMVVGMKSFPRMWRSGELRGGSLFPGLQAIDREII